MSQDEAILNSKEIKPVAKAIIELRLSEGISKIVEGECLTLSIGLYKMILSNPKDSFCKTLYTTYVKIAFIITFLCFGTVQSSHLFVLQV